MNKLVYVGPSILELSKIIRYEFRYDNVKPKYKDKTKLCCMESDSFIVYVETGDIQKDVAKNVETRFEISNYELEKPLPEKIKR